MSNPKTPEDIHLVGLCGSLREGSFTRMALVEALAGATRTGVHTELIDLREYKLPFAGTDDSSGPEWPDVARLKATVAKADGIILATPEYHGSFSGILKNALDLMGFDEFEGKMVGLIGVSGGRMGAADALNTLRGIGRSLHAWVLPQQASIPEAWKVFAGNPDAKLLARLREVGSEVAKFARVHKCASAGDFLEMWQKAPENPGGDQ